MVTRYSHPLSPHTKQEIRAGLEGCSDHRGSVGAFRDFTATDTLAKQVGDSKGRLGWEGEGVGTYSHNDGLQKEDIGEGEALTLVEAALGQSRNWAKP